MEYQCLFPEGFGELLKAYRKRQRVTQRQLAQRLGVHMNTLSAWELGTHLPAARGLVLELARHLALNEHETRQLLEASLAGLAPYWSVPLPRNPFFTGREEILETLHVQLAVDHASARTRSCALYGLGGVGKTQIALEYAYRRALEYRAVFWIKAEESETIRSSFLRIAEMLQLPERQHVEQLQVITAVQHWLARHSHWLLIWDNLEDMGLLPRFLPSSLQGAILITTRRQTLGSLAFGLELSPMGQEEGVAFLFRRAKILTAEVSGASIQHLLARMPVEYTAAKVLVTTLGGLPLALDQAGAYIEETRCGVATYLTLFQTRNSLLLQQRDEFPNHPESVSTTFRLSLLATTQCHPAAHEFLQVCALLQPHGIPEELFLQGARYLGATLEAACQDLFEWNQMVAAACAYSLLQRQPEEQTFSMHRLVQMVLKGMLSEAAQHSWKRRVLHAMSQLFPCNEKGQADYWQQCERLLPHALLCLTWREEEGEELCVTLMNRIATYFSERSQYIEAEALYRRAMHLGEQTLGADHPQVGEILYGLASLQRKRGQYAEVEALYVRALRLREQALEVGHPQISEALCGLASFYVDRGRYAEAEALYQRVLSIQEHTLGAEQLQVATALQGLAVLYDDQGRYTEAEPLYRSALSIREHILGADHPQVAVVLHNLAESYREQSRYAEAEPLFLQALHIWQQKLGSEHPRVAHPLQSLAEMYREQGRYAEAEPPLLRALHIWERAVGPEHHLVATSLHSLALLCQEQGRYVEAETHFQRALSIQEQHFDPQHPETAHTLHDLSIFRQRQGRLSQAITLAERALAIRSQTLGEAHPHTMATRALVVQLRAEQVNAREHAQAQQMKEERDASGNGAGRVYLESPSFERKGEVADSQDDPLQAFLDACCELHPRACCRSSDLWQTYQQWAAAHQERYPLTRGAFIVQLKGHNCHADRTRSTRIWRGIALVKPQNDGR